MRTLFLLLLLANLLFAAWVHWVAPAPSAPGYPTPSATGPGSVQLLREVPTTEAQSSSGGGRLALDGADLSCLSAGPFLARADAEQAAARLESLGFSVRLRDAQEEVRVGQWVRLEGLATPEDAENARAAVQAAGLTDAVVVVEEGIGPVVSLGVHADPSRAEATAAVARLAGFEPRTVDRLRAETVTWLDIDRESTSGLPALDEIEASVGGRPLALEFRPCPVAGAGT